MFYFDHLAKANPSLIFVIFFAGGPETDSFCSKISKFLPLHPNWARFIKFVFFEVVLFHLRGKKDSFSESINFPFWFFLKNVVFFSLSNSWALLWDIRDGSASFRRIAPEAFFCLSDLIPPPPAGWSPNNQRVKAWVRTSTCFDKEKVHILHLISKSTELFFVIFHFFVHKLFLSHIPPITQKKCNNLVFFMGFLLFFYVLIFAFSPLPGWWAGSSSPLKKCPGTPLRRRLHASRRIAHRPPCGWSASRLAPAGIVGRHQQDIGSRSTGGKDVYHYAVRAEQAVVRIARCARIKLRWAHVPRCAHTLKRERCWLGGAVDTPAPPSRWKQSERHECVPFVQSQRPQNGQKRPQIFVSCHVSVGGSSLPTSFVNEPNAQAASKNLLMHGKRFCCIKRHQNLTLLIEIFN